MAIVWRSDDAAPVIGASFARGEMTRMRLLVSGILIAVLGVLGAGLSRLGATLEQLRTVQLPAASPGAAPLEAPQRRALRGGGASNVPPTVEAADPPLASAQSGQRADRSDDHILRALAADPEFQRAAAGLVGDPDPAVQAEARQLLRDLGAAQSE